MIPGHNGMYSDDPLEDSLLRDDELRLQEELDREYAGYEDKSNAGGWIPLVIFIAAILLLIYVFKKFGILAFIFLL